MGPGTPPLARSCLCFLSSPSSVLQVEVNKQEDSLTGPPVLSHLSQRHVPITSVQPRVDSDSQVGETSFHKHFGVCTKKVLDEAALIRSPVRQFRTRQPGPQLSWISVYSLVDIGRGSTNSAFHTYYSVFTPKRTRCSCECPQMWVTAPLFHVTCGSTHLRSHYKLASAFKSGYREGSRALLGVAGPLWGCPSETFCLSVTLKVANVMKQPAW